MKRFLAVTLAALMLLGKELLLSLAVTPLVHFPFSRVCHLTRGE